MNTDDANRAATGTPIHREAPATEAYTPIPGIPGETLIQQYQASQKLIESGDITERQGRAIMQKLAEAFPGASVRGSEGFIGVVSGAIHTFRLHMDESDRAYVLFRWRHCHCGECPAISNLFARWFTEDGREIPGAFD